MVDVLDNSLLRRSPRVRELPGIGPFVGNVRPPQAWVTTMFFASSKPLAPRTPRYEVLESDRTLLLHGEIDFSNSQVLLDAGQVLLACCVAQQTDASSAEDTDAVIDVAGLRFIDAAGLGALVTLGTDLRGVGIRLQVAHPSAQLRRMSAICNLDAPLGLVRFTRAPSRPVNTTRRHPLEASADPSVVFADLAAQSVPELCDGCVVDIDTDSTDSTRIVFPPTSATVGGLLRLADGASASGGHVVRVPFRDPQPLDAPGRVGEIGGTTEGFRGQASFVWHRRTPTHSDRAAAFALVDNAVRTVAWQRGDQAARTADRKAANLELALQTSRHIGAAIGIVMSTHKITEDQAFDLLRITSQHRNLKLRDLACEVIDTGSLEPAVTTDAIGPL